MDNVIPFRAPDGWENRLNRDGNGNPRATLSNLGIIFNHAPQTKGHVRFNDVTKQVEVTGGEFAGVSEAVLHLTVTCWLEREYRMSVASGLVCDALLMVAYENRFDPLSEYLRGLVWDGTSRIDDFLIRYMGAVTVDAGGEDIAEHVRRISRRWMISAVARALDPGCQVDSVLILEGAQGIKKTSVVRVLGGAWFGATELNLHDKDSRMLVSTAWILELAELTSILRGAHKGFLTERTDKFRPPYGRRLESFLRRAIFVGTSNDEVYLTDPTGNRRFWVVRLKGQIDTVPVGRDRDQLFAEAVKAFDAGERWWLEPHEAAVAEQQAHERMAQPAYAEQIWTWWCELPEHAPAAVKGAPPPLGRKSPLAFTDVLARALQLSAAQQADKRVRDAAGLAMKSLGFLHKKVNTGGGRRQWVYQATPGMLEV